MAGAGDQHGAVSPDGLLREIGYLATRAGTGDPPGRY